MTKIENDILVTSNISFSGYGEGIHAVYNLKHVIQYPLSRYQNHGVFMNLTLETRLQV